MFMKQKRKDYLREQIENLEKQRDMARDSLSEVRVELSELKAKKDREEQEIKHLLKMERERLDIERIKFETRCEREKDAEVAQVKDQYRDKLEKRLETEVSNIREMYGEILERLPNVNVRLKGEA